MEWGWEGEERREYRREDVMMMMMIIGDVGAGIGALQAALTLEVGKVGGWVARQDDDSLES